MATVSYNKFNYFVEDVAHKLHALNTDTFFVQLLNTTPTATMHIETDLPADLSTANGYTAGGVTVGTAASSGQTTGTYKLTITDKVITASGGSIGPFQYVALFNNTATNKNLIGWFNYGSAVTLADGETFTIDFDGTNGVLTLA